MDTEPANNESIGRAAKRTFGEMLRVILLSLAIILPVRYFLIQPFYVKGASMEPNFYDREYLVIDEISYRFHPPSRGDIIVFRPPGQAGQYFIKRVIGLPGETVTIAKGAIYVSANAKSKGTKLDESSYLPLIYTPGELQVTLKADEFFILGDNRASSLDSRAFGPLPKSNIVGRVWIRGWPLEKAGTIAVPSYPVGG